MSDPIDRIVKGAPPPDVSAEQVAAKAKASSSSSSITAPLLPDGTNSDPRDALPSSPPQIYLNLLILESSLRLQYISLRARLKLHLLLVVGLAAWNLLFTYLLFFRPREDGSGVGGSVYWVVESTEKLGWCSGVVTLCLFWGTGMYERGVRWPRKFVSTTNRGLRGFNLKVVVVKGSVLSEAAGWLAMLDQMGWFREDRVNFQIVPKDIELGAPKDHWNAHAERHGMLEEDIAPGGDVLRVLLLPKPFSPDFREGWDTFRMEYWERENARRATLRSVVRARKREVAKRDGGWLWWTGWRGWRNVRLNIFSGRKSRRQMELEKLAIKDKPSAERIKERRRKESLLRAGSHSRQSSQSRTPTPDPEGGPQRRPRRGSSTHSTAAGTRRPRRPPVDSKSRLSATETLLHESRGPTALSKRSSTISASSAEDAFKKEEDTSSSSPMKQENLFADEIKQEPAEA
ncbi:Sporulation-specific protein spo7 [Fulvia fulva]|uniref:Sporulation-specific protein spo7 n=1 Tax=Passalora fulva TaxID=5499 RepID=A0A9Q8P5H2_PASFU|nr:Sporulation-specific protein spo7 [Fulvia fulva]KAK4632408.1 Sporulation-specific protein spo7 [Fulvia fulva]KAK4632905.1 Sporulation-specific protein spo7 [Fulvia fulva]UJO13993.1 Sporulation-specific protein spo7 [Fulvia fulva]WPV11559.1 Sporulation-specific protein spo7 [Fulvia fulva]WPV25827.1 Sporulation-specific protein spo7 [Fulvia fulva]